MFHDDAVAAAPVIGIALTARNKKSQDETPMCGVPYHSVAGPINKLLARGLKVAICDQVEDPKIAKGLVRREVTRVLTPGMVYDPDTLDFRKPNYIACRDLSQLACVDTSTGEAFVYRGLHAADIDRLMLLLPIAEVLPGDGETAVDVYLSRYIHSMSNSEGLVHIQAFEERSLQQKMHLSATTLKHLEIFESYSGKPEGTLLRAVDRTVTAAGARLLRSRMAFPLMNLEQILQQQQRVRVWLDSGAHLKNFRGHLGKMGDIERRVAKIASPQNSGRDLLALADSLEAALNSLQYIPALFKDKITEDCLARIQDLLAHIRNTLLEEQPVTIRSGRVIRLGVHAQLDEYVNLAQNSQSLVLEMESQERESTGIGSLKIRYNSVFGYYIEVTNAHSSKVPTRYQRKQTLVNAERFCTNELIELEKKVLSAESKREALEVELYNSLRAETLKAVESLLQFAAFCSELDFSASMAWLALERSYCFPEFSRAHLSLIASRHPVVEQISKAQFVANDLKLDAGEGVLLTGPNMAGKSTLMRQVALIAILAQMGGPVPARKAELPIYDRISTRIGASDQLTDGLSTFMVEMKETAEILQRSTSASLLILDEIGRGTSTYDGMSLAQSILEYILKKIGSQFLFATHYHELSKIQHAFARVKNYHMRIAEKDGQIQFLYSLRAGPAGKSYGLHVAELAGLPDELLMRAKVILSELEAGKVVESEQIQMSFLENRSDSFVRDELDQKIRFVLKAIEEFDISDTTPLRALTEISAWKTDLLSLSSAKDHRLEK